MPSRGHLLDPIILRQNPLLASLLESDRWDLHIGASLRSNFDQGWFSRGTEMIAELFARRRGKHNEENYSFTGTLSLPFPLEVVCLSFRGTLGPTRVWVNYHREGGPRRISLATFFGLNQPPRTMERITDTLVKAVQQRGEDKAVDINIMLYHAQTTLLLAANLFFPISVTRCCSV